ncbi:hypothetical protein ANN_19732 [Periplaneta americana]|uniref:Tc1-like transposase DDE domain-containing protein n=1 Tax=Periplaneta americana TaxID=6978 RepID=A0ABQ8SBR5_PERAM|nr:hypothetical protein ANN_19732 [Periplaneta americana]
MKPLTRLPNGPPTPAAISSYRQSYQAAQDPLRQPFKVEEEENWTVAMKIPTRHLPKSKDRFRTYEIDTVAIQHGHTVLRLPPYHCDFNPIELIWAQVKSDVAKHNTDFKISKTKELFEAALEKITPENWNSACEHVRYIEDFYRSKDGIVDELLDSFVINLGESDTGTDTDECEETDDISIFMEAGPSATGCMDGIAPLPQSP